MKSSNGYLVQPMFSEGTSHFEVFFGGALNLLRHVVELPVSFSMS